MRKMCTPKRDKSNIPAEDQVANDVEDLVTMQRFNESQHLNKYYGMLPASTKMPVHPVIADFMIIPIKLY
jgi:hypothetical protein